MYCLKGACAFLLLAFGLSGCAGIGRGIWGSIVEPDREKGPVYLEQIDNNEFLEFVLENNIVEGLKREDVIYVDNILMFGRLESGKLILTKDAFYRIWADEDIGIWPNYKVDLDRLRKEYMRTRGEKNYIYWPRPIHKDYYVTSEYIIKTEINSDDKFFYDFCNKAYISCERLQVIGEARGDVKWYQLLYKSKQWHFLKNIYHRRFNDIHKIKAVIDERVAYFLSLENNQTNATSADQ
jgi:hypothetical protein